MSPCRVCNSRKPKRSCPGIHSDICPQCCGSEREVSILCPLDCEYLLQVRMRTPLPDIDPDKFPNKDIPVTEEFLRENEALTVAIARSLLEIALETPGAVDSDVADALDAMIRSWRTLQSGLIYQTTPSNPLASLIQRKLEERIQEFRDEESKATGIHAIRDAQVLGVLAFLERMQIQQNNGLKKGRAFLSFLRTFFPAPDARAIIT